MKMSDEADANTSTAPAASSARARAEARRRRILEKSKDRMSVVSGATIPTNDANIYESTNENNESETSLLSSNEKGKGDTENLVTNGANITANATATTTAGSPASKGSARLAQMRRRRYKKTAAKGSDTNDTDKPSTQNVTDNERSEDIDKKRADTETYTSEVATAKDEENISPIEKKKYLGVVKMRRKMLAEKKASEAQAENTTGAAATAKNVSSKKLKLSRKEKNTISLGPIFVQFMTVILLFLAGFDVGVQNHVVVKQDVPTIHTNFAISDHGIGAMKLVGISTSSSQNQINNDAIIDQDLYQLNDGEEEEFIDNEEEFSEAKPKGVSTSSNKEPNIDPVFGIDFDEITAGDGTFLALVRMAVSFHRMLTHFFFTMPLAVFSGLFVLPKRILANPPILFLCAVSIRFVGKHVLGGSLPDLDKMLEAEINESDAMKGKEGVAETIANTDLVSMGTNFVKNFFKTNFPKLVLFWTIFNDARSDMFVVFCGFFLGLIVPSNLLEHEASYLVSEEL